MPDPKGLARGFSSEGGSRFLFWRITLVWSLLLGQSLGQDGCRSPFCRVGSGLLRGVSGLANEDDDNCRAGVYMQVNEEKGKSVVEREAAVPRRWKSISFGGWRRVRGLA